TRRVRRPPRAGPTRLAEVHALSLTLLARHHRRITRSVAMHSSFLLVTDEQRRVTFNNILTTLPYSGTIRTGVLMTSRYSDPGYSNLDLSDSIGQLGSFLSAVLSELLVQVAELDQREAYRDDGAFSMESWLCTRLGLSYATAQEYVRVARALAALPRCAQALAEGRFSWDQVRALTRFARPEEDEASRPPPWSGRPAELAGSAGRRPRTSTIAA